MTTILARGFSLVELLVSMVLLSAIVLLTSYSYAQFSSYWDGRLGRFDETFAELRDGWLLESILQNVHPYVVKNSQSTPVYYFEGNINGFIGVSKEAISENGTPAVIRLSLIQNEDLTFDLVYEEAPMKQSALLNLQQNIAFKRPAVTLFSGLREAKFAYFGPERATNDETVIPKSVWSSEYNSAVTLEYPRRVSLNWESDQGGVRWFIELTQPAPGVLSALVTQEFEA